MKKVILSIFAISTALIFSSCEVDNLDGPNAQIYGEIRDITTGELVEQDIVNGSLIYFTELGFDNPPLQSTVFKNDGTYRNNLMFAGKYIFRLEKGNYAPLAPMEDVVLNGGGNRIDFKVMPYIRLRDATITLDGTQVVARFRIEQAVSDHIVQKIALFGHPDITVGNGIKMSLAEVAINADVPTDKFFEIRLNVNPSETKYKTGNFYYFRVGALSNAPEARFNYASPVKILL